jgi:regulatory protein
MLQKKKLTPDQGWQRAKLYCAYQERSHVETKEKLYSFGLPREEVEQIIARLIDEDYLNEERFAAAFARGKFRIKHWGRVKIRYELKQKYISELCIKKAMKEIDEDEYLKTLEKLIEEKLEELCQEKDILNRKKKVWSYLLQKGYERDIIFSFFKE